MLDIEEVTYTFATVECDWPACTNRMSLQPGPEDLAREEREIGALRNLAARCGRIIDDSIPEAICPHHNQKEKK